MELNKKVTNEELFERFEEIFQMDNPFDVEVAVRNYKKSYRNSEYFAATRYGIKKAYKQYIKFKATAVIKEASELFSVQGLSNKINKVLDGVDSSILDAALDRLTGAMDISSIEQLQGDFNKTVEKLRK